MLPTREKAEELLQDAEKCNPGPWGNHSRVAAHCAEKIGKDIYVVVDKDSFKP